MPGVGACPAGSINLFIAGRNVKPSLAPRPALVYFLMVTLHQRYGIKALYNTLATLCLCVKRPC